MQTLFLLTLVLTGWRLASLDEPSGGPAIQAPPPVAAVTQTPAMPAAAIPYRLVDGVDYVKPKPKVRGVPAPKAAQQNAARPQTAIPPAATPYPARAPVYVYVYLMPAPSTPALDYYAIEDAYYNPVFKGADQIHYRPWPAYLKYGRFYPADISFPYPYPPQPRCFYRYLPAYLSTLNQITMPLYTPRPTCHLPFR